MTQIISLAAYRAKLSQARCTCGEAMRALGAHGMRCPVTLTRADALDEALKALTDEATPPDVKRMRAKG